MMGPLCLEMIHTTHASVMGECHGRLHIPLGLLLGDTLAATETNKRAMGQCVKLRLAISGHANIQFGNMQMPVFLAI